MKIQVGQQFVYLSIKELMGHLRQDLKDLAAILDETEDYEYVRACVNACRDIPLEELEGKIFTSGVKIEQLKAPTSFYVLEDDSE